MLFDILNIALPIAMPDLLQIEYIPLSRAECLLFDRNPKKHDIGAIATSISRYGFKDPPKFEPLLNGGEGGIVEGNGRVETLIWMYRQKQEIPRGIAIADDGEWCIPVVFGVDAESEKAAAAYAIDHNHLSLAGSSFTALDMSRLWESEGYLELLKYLDDELPVTVDGDDLDLLLEQLQNNLDEHETPTEEEDEETTSDLIEDAEQGKIEGRVQEGQIWQLGKHFIACGDSTDLDNIERLLEVMGRQSADMVWADPPYGINAVSKDGKTGTGKPTPFGGAKNRSDGVKTISATIYAPIIGDDGIETAIAAASLSLDIFPKALQIWWGANHYIKPFKESSCWLIWDKQTDGNNFADAELAWCSSSTTVRIFRHLWQGMVRASEHGKRFHPTQKPVALCEWAFEKYGNPGDLIFDPFLGSAPSILAAQKMNDDRVVAGFEMSKDYCEIICRRFESFTGINAKLVGHL